MRRASLLAAGCAAALALPAAALAHQGNPNMTTVVRSITPPTPGVRVDVLGAGDELELRNTSGEPIVLYGYSGEQYARMLPSGKVQENRNSPAYYLNQDYYGQVDVPAHATPKAPPDWTTVANDGRLRWHDHRSHYMGTGTPPGIRDKGRRQRWGTFAVPLRIAGRRGAIHGTIWWSPVKQGGPPVWAIAVLVVLAAGGGALAVTVRRRRRGATGAGAGATEGREAW